MPHLRAAAWTALREDKSERKNLLLKISCNPLISLDSDERIQGNPRKSKPHILGFSQRNGDRPRNSKRSDRTAIEKARGRLHLDPKRSSAELCDSAMAPQPSGIAQNRLVRRGAPTL